MQKGDVKKRTERERERDVAGKRREQGRRKRRGRKGNERWREDEDVREVVK